MGGIGLLVFGTFLANWMTFYMVCLECDSLIFFKVLSLKILITFRCFSHLPSMFFRWCAFFRHKPQPTQSGQEQRGCPGHPHGIPQWDEPPGRGQVHHAHLQALPLGLAEGRCPVLDPEVRGVLCCPCACPTALCQSSQSRMRWPWIFQPDPGFKVSAERTRCL